MTTPHTCASSPSFRPKEARNSGDRSSAAGASALGAFDKRRFFLARLTFPVGILHASFCTSHMTRCGTRLVSLVGGAFSGTPFFDHLDVYDVYVLLFTTRRLRRRGPLLEVPEQRCVNVRVDFIFFPKPFCQ